jgi:hypothetical protein
MPLSVLVDNAAKAAIIALRLGTQERLMEIDITKFFASAEPAKYSGSVAELGNNAGRITWNNALAEADNAALLKTESELQAMRDWAMNAGAWTDDQIAAWSPTQLNALFLQLISGDIRELRALATDDHGEIDWTRADELSNKGTIGGNLYAGDNGNVYYYLGS